MISLTPKDRRALHLWRDNGLWLSLNHMLLLIGREAAGREASSSAGVIDSQSVKTTESGGPCGYDAGKKIKGSKRHILTDTDGNLVHAVIHGAHIQDRDGAPLVRAGIIRRFPWLRHVFADRGYAGDKLRQALCKIGNINSSCTLSLRCTAHQCPFTGKLFSLSKGLLMAKQTTTVKDKSTSAKRAPTSVKSKTVSRAKPKKGAPATRKAAVQNKKPKDAIALLKADHKEVDTMFKEFEKTEDDTRKQELADKICKALSVHAQIEEEIFYPAAYDALDEEGDDMLDEAEVEHGSAKDLIAQIEASSAGEPLFDAKVTVLGEYVRHHVEEEEKQLFPECRDSKMDLVALGEAMAQRKDELMSD